MMTDKNSLQMDMHQTAGINIDSDLSLLAEELAGLQTIMRALFIISLPALLFFTLFNYLNHRIIESMIICSMLIMMLLTYYISRHKSRCMEKQYRFYQNVFRGFLLLFIIYLFYAAGINNDLDRLQWSYIMPIIAFVSLKKKESMIWAVFYITGIALILFTTQLSADSQDLYRNNISGYKVRYLFSFSLICAAGIAWKSGIERIYLRLVQRQERIAVSEAKYREAFEAQQVEMDERLKAQQALVKSEENYRQIFENSFDIIYSMDREFRLINISPSVETILGYKPFELIDKPFYELGILTQESMDLAYKNIMTVFTGKTIPVSTYTFIAKNGSRHYVEISGMPLIRHGEVSGLISIARDITDRVSVEKALQESLDRFNIIVNNARDAIWMMDMDLRLTFMSPAIESILGYTVEEYLAKPNHETITPDSMKLLLRILDEEIKLENDPGSDPHRSRIVEIEQVHKNGNHVWVELKMNFIKNPEGRAVGILGFSKDITEIKRTAEEKKKLEEHIQHIARIESIGTLAGGIAHDFNNLLMGIQGYTSLLLMNTDPSHPNYNRLRQIEEQIQSGAGLTNQLLGFARGGKYEIKPTSMNKIVEKTSSIFARTKKEISIHRVLYKDLWTVEADRGQMEQILMNLFVNSSEAIPGSGDIYVETENIVLDENHVYLSSVKPGRYVKISVTDTGIGIDEKIRDKIFDPFFTTKSMKRGTGLGLATVYGIVKGHNGMINVYSEPGHGTTFTVYLPASDREVEPENTGNRAIVTGHETILIVDDESAVMETSTEILKSLGYTVYPVGNSQDAITFYEKEKNKIDLIILDMIMPGLSGEDVFNHIKNINPDVKILLSSGYSLNEKARAIMDRGCNGFLQKPFDKEKLSNKIREILD